MSVSEKESQAFAKYDQQSMAKLWPIIFHYRYLLIAASSAYILFNLMGLSLPWMLKISIDRVLPNADYMLFWVMTGAMLLIYIIRFILRYIASYLTDYTGIRFIVDIRQKIFKHLQSLSLCFYQEYRTGKLISNVISDVALLNSLMRLFGILAEQTFQLLLIMLLLYFINWEMALAVSLLLPLTYVNHRYFNKKMRHDSIQFQEHLSNISANFSEAVQGVKVIKSFAREHSAERKFFCTLKPLIDAQMQVTVHNCYMVTFFDILTLVIYLVAIGFGIRYIQSGVLTIGEFVAFYSYVGMAIGPINMLANLSMTFAQGFAGGCRVVNLLETIPDIREAPNPIHPGRLRGLIEFQNVVFQYKKAPAPTIRDFSMVIQPGQKIALVGPSGSGKSTIANLLLRFYDISSGSILVDGIDIRRFAFEPYRKQVGVVLQEPFLFSGTIRENIAYARENASDEEVEAAAALANVEEFVNRLPDGYDTVIGENGASLSGGQRQRIAIARAVLNNPSMLILDEATSALDTVSEQLVQEALDRLMEGKTTIIIAHRLSTIQNADCIVVLADGRVVQKGTHDELVNRPGVYQDLYRKQKKMAASR